MISALFIALLPALASAHVTMNPNVLPPNSYAMSVARLPHGCDGSSTVNVTVIIPDGVTSVKPAPVAGWELSLASKPLDPPITMHGKVINTTVASISWTSKTGLLDAYFTDFPIQMKLPNVPEGTVLYFQTLQTCEKGNNSWVDIPNGAAEPEHPAPSIKISAAVNAYGAPVAPAAASLQSSASAVSAAGLLTSLFLFLN